MAREYTITAGGLTVANQAVTLVFLNPASPGASIEILRCWVSQSANATSAQQRVQLVTQVTAFPTLVTFTPKKTKITDPVSGIVGGTAGAAGTCGYNASAEGAGTKTILVDDAFNVVTGWLWVPQPREGIVLNALVAAGFGLHLPVAPATLTGWSCGVTYAELG